MNIFLHKQPVGSILSWNLEKERYCNWNHSVFKHHRISDIYWLWCLICLSDRPSSSLVGVAIEGPHCRAPAKEGERASGADLRLLTSIGTEKCIGHWRTQPVQRIGLQKILCKYRFVWFCWCVAVDMLFLTLCVVIYRTKRPRQVRPRCERDEQPESFITILCVWLATFRLQLWSMDHSYCLDIHGSWQICERLGTKVCLNLPWKSKAESL